jgi:hypothetical protein
MRLRDQYDWAVLGDHPGALLTAGIAAKLGLSVLVLPLGETLRSRVSPSGQCLDPESNFMLGLGKQGKANGLLADSLGRLGLNSSEESRVLAEPELFQVATPSRRLRFMADDDDWARELRREFGDNVAATSGMPGALSAAESPVQTYWRELPDRFKVLEGKPVRRGGASRIEDVRKEISSHLKGRTDREKAWVRRGSRATDLARASRDPAWEEIAAGAWHGTSSQERDDPELWELLQLMALGRTGASFRGGVSAFRELLTHLAKRLGAHVPDRTDCRRIFIEDGRFSGIQAAGSGNMIGARGGVLGCGLPQALMRASNTGRQWPRKLRAGPTPRGWKFTLALTLHAEAVPPGLSRRLIWQEDGSPALEVEVAEPRDYGISEPGNRLVFARTVLPFTPESLHVEHQRMVAARMLRQLTELIPFMEFHVVRIFPDFRTRPEDLKEAYRFTTLEEVPENLKAFSGTGTGSRSGIEGLFVASGESFPELGSLGPVVAAIESSAWLAHRCGLAGPFG